MQPNIHSNSDNHEHLFPSHPYKMLNTAIHNDQNHIIAHLVILFISLCGCSAGISHPLHRNAIVSTRNPVARTFFLPFAFVHCILLVCHYYRLCWHSNARRYMWIVDGELKCTLNRVYINRSRSLIIAIYRDYMLTSFNSIFFQSQLLVYQCDGQCIEKIIRFSVVTTNNTLHHLILFNEVSTTEKNARNHVISEIVVFSPKQLKQSQPICSEA